MDNRDIAKRARVSAATISLSGMECYREIELEADTAS
jgi:hypothetical protein